MQEFEFNLEDNIFSIRSELLNRTYIHKPYHSFYVRDPKLRHIHKAEIRDRVVHQALFRILYKIFDNNFIFDSHSCRVNKGAHRAIKRLKIFAGRTGENNHKTVFVLKCDIKKFFDSIDQKTLLDILKTKIRDSDALWLISVILESFEKEQGHGLPLGNVTSQLFANLYLNELDQFIKNKLKIKYYIRYCDDFVVCHRDKNFLIVIIKNIQSFLIERLGLSLHERKVIIRKYSQGIDFLGYIVKPKYIILRTKTKNRILKKIADIKRYFLLGKVTENSFNQSLQSYLGILGYCKGFKISQIIKNL